MELKELPNYGDHMLLKKFLKDVRDGMFIDYDGHGYLATEFKMSDIYFKPNTIYDKIVEYPKLKYVIWFNK